MDALATTARCRPSHRGWAWPRWRRWRCWPCCWASTPSRCRAGCWN